MITPEHITRIIERLDPVDREALEQHLSNNTLGGIMALQQIRDAIGDPHGRLIQDEVVSAVNALVKERDEHLDHLKQICEIVGEVHDGKHDIGVAWESVAAIKHQRDELATQCESLATSAAMAVGALPDKSPIAAVCVAAVRKYNHTGGPDFKRVFDASLVEVRAHAVKEFANQVFDELIKQYRHIKIAPLTMAEEYADRIRKEAK